MAVASWTNLKVHSPTDRTHLKSSAVLRSAAVLTGSYVASDEVLTDEFTAMAVYFSVTQASLTSVEYKVQQSFDGGSTWYDLAAESVTLTSITDGLPAYTRTLATDENWYKVFPVVGNRFRVQVKGTGTVTASSCTVTVVGASGGSIGGSPGAGTGGSWPAPSVGYNPATDVKYFSMTIYDPDTIQAVQDAIPVLPVESDWAPYGITLRKVGIKTHPSSTYSVNFEEWTSPADGSPSTIETVATAAGTEAEDDGTLTDADIAVGSIIYVDLPATDIDMLMVWGTYTINGS